MKTIEKQILPFQEDLFFVPLRNRFDYARLIVFALQTFLIDYDAKGLDCRVKIRIIVDRMSRLFVYKEDKFFSVAWPFTLHETDNGSVNFLAASGETIDNRTVSEVLSLLNDVQSNQIISLRSFDNGEDTFGNMSLDLLDEIFSLEPAYIRYDRDLKNAKGRLHPAYHLDVNYSTQGTFKIGLNKHISDEYFEDLQNINTECYYIQ